MLDGMISEPVSDQRDSPLKHFVIVFTVAFAGYWLTYHTIHHRRNRNVPWDVSFTNHHGQPTGAATDQRPDQHYGRRRVPHESLYDAQFQSAARSPLRRALWQMHFHGHHLFAGHRNPSAPRP